MAENLNMDDNKKEATKYLVESIKLAFTVSSVFGAGVVAYASRIEEMGPFFWMALVCFFLTLVFSIFCINTIVNKIWTKDKELIYNKDLVRPWIIMMAVLLLAFVFMCIFIFASKKTANDAAVEDSALYLKTENIELKYNQSYDIEYSKDSTGQIQLNVKQLSREK